MLFIYLNHKQPVLTLEEKPAYKHLSRQHSEVRTGLFISTIQTKGGEPLTFSATGKRR